MLLMRATTPIAQCHYFHVLRLASFLLFLFYFQSAHFMAHHTLVKLCTVVTFHHQHYRPLPSLIITDRGKVDVHQSVCISQDNQSATARVCKQGKGKYLNGQWVVNWVDNCVAVQFGKSCLCILFRCVNRHKGASLICFRLWAFHILALFELCF